MKRFILYNWGYILLLFLGSVYCALSGLIAIFIPLPFLILLIIADFLDDNNEF